MGCSVGSSSDSFNQESVHHGLTRGTLLCDAANVSVGPNRHGEGVLAEGSYELAWKEAFLKVRDEVGLVGRRLQLPVVEARADLPVVAVALREAVADAPDAAS